MGFLTGVPALLVWVVQVPIPTWSLVRDAWTRQHLSSEAVVAAGTAVFAVLWLWFCGTALAEVSALRSWRRLPSGSSSDEAPPIPRGPGRWIRVLVRVALVSTVAVSIGHGAVEATRVEAAITADLAGPTGPSSDATRRESATPASPDDDSLGDSLLPFLAGLSGALMLSIGAVAAIDHRRRRQWRAARVGVRLARPTLQQVRTEMLMRSVDPSEQLARLDLALRAVAPHLVDDGFVVAAARVDDSGEVVLYATGHRRREHDAAPWVVRPGVTGSEWLLPARLTLAELAALAEQRAQPSPAMLHIGRAMERDADVFVDPEAVGLLAVLSPVKFDALRSMAATAALSPFLDDAAVLVAGVDGLPAGLRCEHVDSLDAAVDLAMTSLGSTRTAASTGTFAARSSAIGDQFAPVLVVAANAEVTDLIAADLAAFGAGHGLGVVTDALPSTMPAGWAPWCIRVAGGRHVLEPLDLAISPVSLQQEALSAIGGLLDTSEIATSVDAEVAEVMSLGSEAASSSLHLQHGARWIEPEWSFMVRVLGPVEVVSADGVPVVFERSKALELVAWLSQHRERPTRSAARTALWDSVVRDATFANVVSDARRAMARSLAPEPGEEWISRTLTDDLPLHDAVITDADLLAARVDAARRLPRDEAIELLRPGVELLGGLPFVGTSYLWTDAEGITSSLVLLATGAAIELAQHLLEADDIDGVFWATGQGLKVLGGHEELIALRMRAHARRGDLAGVRHEWESYERALAADSWAAADPSPKLVALRSDLLALRAPVSR